MTIENPGAAAETAAAAAAAQAAAATAWHTGLDAEIVGHVQNKGWHSLDPAAAAREIAKAHREAERHIGVPSDQILRLPKDATDEAGWNAVFSRLGKPAAATEYDLAGVKFADETPLSDAAADFVRNTAFNLNLPKDAATRLGQEFAKFLDSADASEVAEHTAKLAEGKAELAKEWGANQEANLFIAKQAAAKLGVSPEAVAALEQTAGYAAVMKMFQKIGTAIGEDKFVSGGVGPSGILTREQAVAKKAELQADSAWVKRYLDGGQAEFREMQALSVIIAG